LASGIPEIKADSTVSDRFVILLEIRADRTGHTGIEMFFNEAGDDRYVADWYFEKENNESWRIRKRDGANCKGIGLEDRKEMKEDGLAIMTEIIRKDCEWTLSLRMKR
jgi:hypothetical protein